MNRSADEVALVPLGVVTVTSTTPAAWAGAVAVIEEVEVTVKAAGAEPKSTALVPVKPVPVIVTGVAPVVGPAPALSALTDGASS